MKKLLALFLTVAMLCTFLVVPVSAEGTPSVEMKVTPATFEADGAAKTATLEIVLHNPDPAASKVAGASFTLVSENGKAVIADTAELTTEFSMKSFNAKLKKATFANMDLSSMETYATDKTTITLLKVLITIGEDAAVGDYVIKANDMCVTNTDGENIFKNNQSCTIKLTAPIVAVTGVTLNKSTMSLVATAEETLTATVAPENATNKAVTWSTSNDKVAAVVNGKVTAVAPGEAVITATTADGGFTATCKVTVTEKPCEHPDAKLTKVDAKEATCTEPGNAECWKCGECGKYLSTDKSTVQDTIFGYAPALGHEYGNLVAAVAPTCTVNGNVAYYQCSRCKNYFNADKNPITSIVAPATGHVIQHHAAVAATCVAEGSNEYWSCANCDEKFADKDGKKQFDGEIVIPIDKTKHPGGTSYAGDEKDHWTICNSCKAMLSIKTPHAAASTGAATCVGSAVCDTCKMSFGAVDPKNHASELEHHDAVASTCVKEGNIEYWSCASCKKNFSDAEGKALAENVTLPVDASAHTIVNVPAKPHTCTEDGIIAHYKCTGCGKLFSDEAGENEITNIVDPAAHKLTPVAEKPSNCRVPGTAAYDKCDVCGKMFDKDGKEITAPATLPLAAHTWDTTKWLANKDGHYRECKVCGIADTVITPHIPGAEATETTPQTCTVCGYIIKPATSHKEHTKGNLMSDATSHWYACTGCSEQLEKANHTVTSWTVDKAATTTEEGLRHGNCSVCQHVVYEKLAKINNTPVNPSKPGRPSGTKTVQSGKTFDAGVGVYVGLSILSLTGSAVVIGKKRKTR
mgnify:FL=1